MNFLYVASAIDLTHGEKLECRKVGIAQTDVDKRIGTLNSTKMPIEVELEAGYDFSRVDGLTARDAESVIHALLGHDRVNGEWFRDPDGDLVDRVHKAVVRMGASPYLSAEPEIVEMNDKQLRARLKMEGVFGPLASDLSSLGIHWEYMTWKVGISTSVGRMQANINENDIRLMLTNSDDLGFLRELTGLDWEQLEHKKRVNVSVDELMSFLQIVGAPSGE